MSLKVGGGFYGSAATAEPGLNRFFLQGFDLRPQLLLGCLSLIVGPDRRESDVLLRHRGVDEDVRHVLADGAFFLDEPLTGLVQVGVQRPVQTVDVGQGRFNRGTVNRHLRVGQLSLPRPPTCAMRVSTTSCLACDQPAPSGLCRLNEIRCRR